MIAGLGEHWQFVRQEAESKLLAVQDFDGDGREDFVVRVSIPSPASQVYVYHYDAELGKFVPFLFADDDRLTADYNDPVEVLPEGIAFAYAPGSARRLWRFNGKRFLPF
jgi:hypothetical protein